MAEDIPICVHCWIEVVKQTEMKTVIGPEQSPKWIHKTLRSDTGNPFCGRQFLEDEDVEFVSSAEES